MAEARELRFQSGGTVDESAAYVRRAADDELVEALAAGEFCYILATRQIGKSSLRLRAMRELRRRGVAAVNVDLTAIGSENLTPNNWYFGHAAEIAEALDIEDPDDLWQQGEHLTPVQRWLRWLRDGLLTECEKPVVIFIDEIDSTLALPFSRDDYFAAIRACFNRRADEPAFKRLSFCLIGVAAPSDLIADTARTPFNIGRAIRLDDFTRAEIQPFATGFDLAAEEARGLLDAVYTWTSGHPYMTQRVCADIVESGSLDVDELVRDRFLSGGRAQDPNLLHAELALEGERHGVDRGRMLSLYRRLLLGDAVEADATDPVKNALRLTGHAAERDVNGERHLVARNRVFTESFDLGWVRRRQAGQFFTNQLERWLETRSTEDLLRGSQLDEVESWAAGREDVGAAEREFIAESRKEVQRARSKRWKRQLFAVASLALLVTTLLAIRAAWIAEMQRGAAWRARLEAILGKAEATEARLVAEDAKQATQNYAVNLKSMVSELRQQKSRADANALRAERNEQRATGNLRIATAAQRSEEQPEGAALELRAALVDSAELSASGADEQALLLAEQALRDMLAKLHGRPVCDGSRCAASPDAGYVLESTGVRPLTLTRLHAESGEVSSESLPLPADVAGEAPTALAAGWTPDDGRFPAVAAGFATGQVIVWRLDDERWATTALSTSSDTALVALAVGGDGRRIVAVDRTGRVWSWWLGDAPSAPAPFSTMPLGQPASSIATSARGHRVAVGLEDGRVAFYRAGRDTALGGAATLKTSSPIGPIPVALSEGGQRLAAGTPIGKVRLWDVSRLLPDGHAPQDIPMYERSSRGRASASSKPRRARKNRTWVPIVRLARVTSVSLGSAGRGRFWLAAGFSDNVVVRQGPESEQDAYATFRGHDHPITALAVAPDTGALVTIPEQGVGRLWDTVADATHREPRRIDIPAYRVDAAQFTPDSSQLVLAGRPRKTSTGTGRSHVWSWSPGGSPSPIDGHEYRVPSVAVSTPHGFIVTGSRRGRVCVTPPAGAKLEQRCFGLPGCSGTSHPPVRAVAVAERDGQLLVAAGTERDGRGRIALAVLSLADLSDVAAAALLPRRDDNPPAVWSLRFGLDSERLYAGTSHGILQHDIGSPAPPEPLPGFPGRVYALDVARGQKGTEDWLAAGCEDGWTRIWRLPRSGEPDEVGSWGSHVRTIRAVAFVGTPPTRLATLGVEGLVKLWPWPAPPDGGQPIELAASDGETETQALAVTEDGSLLAVGDVEGHVRLWRLDREAIADTTLALIAPNAPAPRTSESAD